MLMTSGPVACDPQMKAAALAACPGCASAIDQARAAGIPWALIFQMLAQGLPALLAFIQQWLAPKPPVPTP